MSNGYHREPVRFTQPSRLVNSNNSFTSESPVRGGNAMGHVSVISTQAGKSVWDFEHAWAHTLGSCCENTKQCCFAFFCSCCYEYGMFTRAGENPCNCMCPTAKCALRAKLRTAFRIEGDLCNDCIVSACCPCCTAIQLTRELEFQGL